MDDARMSVDPEILVALLSILLTIRSVEHVHLMNAAIIVAVVQPMAKLSDSVAQMVFGLVQIGHSRRRPQRKSIRVTDATLWTCVVGGVRSQA